MEHDEPSYTDPQTGLFVMTAGYLRSRSWGCDRGCRHCHYEAETNPGVTPSGVDHPTSDSAKDNESDER